MSVEFYSTPQEVRVYTGVDANALGLKSEAELDKQIVTWLKHAKAFIDADRNRDFAADGTIPLTIHNIAMRMVANLIRGAERNRNKSVVSFDADGGANELVPDEATMMSKSIREDLYRIPRVPDIRIRAFRQLEED